MSLDNRTYDEREYLMLNPTPEELLQLASNVEVTIEGVFRGYFEYAQHSEYRMSVEIGIEIETPGGLLKIPTHHTADSGMRTTYGDGVLENLLNKEMSKGETIRITTWVTREHTLHGGYSQAFLLTPSEERQAAYDELRRTVAELITQFGAATNKQYRLARSLFAQLRRLELTKDEQRRIQQMMRTLPQHQQSIYNEDRYTADEIAKAFGVDVETLNRAQFLTFTFEVVRGVRESPEDRELRTDQSFLLRYLLLESPVFTHREKVSVLRASLSARLKRLESRTDQHNDCWDDQYLLERTIFYARCIDDPAIVNDIEKLIEYLINMRRQPSGAPRRMSFLLESALDTIEAWKSRKISSARITRRKAVGWREQLWGCCDSRSEIAKLDRVIALLK